MSRTIYLAILWLADKKVILSAHVNEDKAKRAGEVKRAAIEDLLSDAIRGDEIYFSVETLKLDGLDTDAAK